MYANGARKSHVRPGILTEVERSGLLAVYALLRELDPNQEKLDLTCTPTYTGDYRWLCRTHFREWEPKIPDKIEVRGRESYATGL